MTYRGPATCPECRADLTKPGAVLCRSHRATISVYWRCAKCREVVDEKDLS